MAPNVPTTWCRHWSTLKALSLSLRRPQPAPSSLGSAVHTRGKRICDAFNRHDIGCSTEKTCQNGDLRICNFNPERVLCGATSKRSCLHHLLVFSSSARMLSRKSSVRDRLCAVHFQSHQVKSALPLGIPPADEVSSSVGRRISQHNLPAWEAQLQETVALRTPTVQRLRRKESAVSVYQHALLLQESDSLHLPRSGPEEQLEISMGEVTESLVRWLERTGMKSGDPRKRVSPRICTENHPQCYATHSAGAQRRRNLPMGAR